MTNDTKITQHTDAHGHEQTAVRTGGKFATKGDREGAAAPLATAPATMSSEEMIADALKDDGLDLSDHVRQPNGAPVQDARLRKYDEDDDSCFAEITLGDNANWRFSEDEPGAGFTEEQLEEHGQMIADTYEDWFDADVSHFDQNGNEFHVSVDMSAKIADSEVTEEHVLNTLHDMQGRFINETDPGTDNAEYIGNEVEARMKVADTPAVKEAIEHVSSLIPVGEVKYRQDGAYLIHNTSAGIYVVMADIDGDFQSAHIPAGTSMARKNFDTAIDNAEWETGLDV